MGRDQGTPEEAAERMGMLLLRLARERPDVLAAAESFVRALLLAPPAAAEPGREPAEAPSSSEAPEEVGPAEPADAPTTPIVADGVVRIDEAEPSAPLAPTASAVRPVDPKEEAKAMASMDALLARFDGRGATGGVANAPGAKSNAPTPSASPFEADAKHAEDVSHLAMVMARHLRRTRQARRSGEDPPARSAAFVKARAEDWTSTHSGTLSTLQPAELKIAERWYGLISRAFDEIACWFRSREGRQLRQQEQHALHDRLDCAAIAQKGLYCWIEERLPCDARRACGVQMTAFATIRGWVQRPDAGGFGIFLREGMHQNDRVGSDRLERLERTLGALESSHAPEQPSSSDGAQPAAGEPQRFESVADAFEAAKAEFGGPDAPLVFTERAEESAERSPFIRPDEVFEVFRTIHEIALELRAGALDGTPLDTVFAQRGHRKKPCSKSTMKRHHRFYHLPFDGRLVDLSEHITLGSRNQNTCLSIHWWHDAQRGRFVIGHCGKHLPNTMS